MRSPRTIAIVVGAIVAVVVLFLLFNGGDDEEATTSTTTTLETTTLEPIGEDTTAEPAPKPDPSEPAEPKVAVVTIKDGQPVGGVQELEFVSGGTIAFIVRSAGGDDEEIHMHGYDITQDLSAGGEVEFEVPASIEGVFEVELEHSAVPIAEISVIP